MNHFIELVNSCRVAFQEDRTSVVTSNDIFFRNVLLSSPLPASSLSECGLVERNIFDVLECVSSRPLHRVPTPTQFKICV